LKVSSQRRARKALESIGNALMVMGALGLFLGSCVSPPEYTDGLLENIPAVVNESDYFSLSILGDTFSDSLSWDLKFSDNETGMIINTLVLKEVNIKQTDSTYFRVLRADGDTILSLFVQEDLVWSSMDSISTIGVPSRVLFNGMNFSGRFEYQLLKKNN